MPLARLPMGDEIPGSGGRASALVRMLRNPTLWQREVLVVCRRRGGVLEWGFVGAGEPEVVYLTHQRPSPDDLRRDDLPRYSYPEITSVDHNGWALPAQPGAAD